MVLPSGDQQIMNLASKALGKLAAPSGAVTAIFVAREVNTALEYLSGIVSNILMQMDCIYIISYNN